MKNKLAILLIIVSNIVFGQSVPNTTTFSLQDVENAISGTQGNLNQCFTNAISSHFNPTYSGTKNNLLNFRDYGPHNAATIPTVTTDVPYENETQVDYLIMRAVAIGGVVTNTGGSTITSTGVVYSSTDITPTIGEVGVTNRSISSGGGTGGFGTATRTEFTPGTTYYIRAYAANSIGTAYGVIRTYTICTPSYPRLAVVATSITINGVTTSFYTSSIAASQACFDFNNPAGRTISLGNLQIVSSSTNSVPVVSEVPIVAGYGWCHRLTNGWYYTQVTGQDYIVTVSGGVITAVTACP